MAQNSAPIDELAARIVRVRGRRTMIDADLAMVYGVTTKAFNQAVKRNLTRFPEDFVFRLTAEEKSEVVTNCDHLQHLRFSAHLPYAFTEHGALMASTVLKSAAAVEMSVYVVRAFIQLRSLASSHRELSVKISAIERKLGTHDTTLRDLLDLVRALTERPKPKRRPIGFVADLDSPEN